MEIAIVFKSIHSRRDCIESVMAGATVLDQYRAITIALGKHTSNRDCVTDVYAIYLESLMYVKKNTFSYNVILASEGSKVHNRAAITVVAIV
jgi:hypothetical protein